MENQDPQTPRNTSQTNDELFKTPPTKPRPTSPPGAPARSSASSTLDNSSLSPLNMYHQLLGPPPSLSGHVCGDMNDNCEELLPLNEMQPLVEVLEQSPSNEDVSEELPPTAEFLQQPVLDEVTIQQPANEEEVLHQPPLQLLRQITRK